MVLIRAALFPLTDDAMTRVTLGAAADMLAERAASSDTED